MATSKDFEKLWSGGLCATLDSTDAANSRVKELLDENENQRIRLHLAVEVPKIKAETRQMWEYVWSLW